MAESEHKPRSPLKDFVPEEAWKHAQAAHKEMHASLEALLPPEFVAHRRAARREMLLAVRSLIDAALERMDRRAQGPQPK